MSGKVHLYLTIGGYLCLVLSIATVMLNSSFTLPTSKDLSFINKNTVDVDIERLVSEDVSGHSDVSMQNKNEVQQQDGEVLKLEELPEYYEIEESYLLDNPWAKPLLDRRNVISEYSSQAQSATYSLINLLYRPKLEKVGISRIRQDQIIAEIIALSDERKNIIEKLIRKEITSEEKESQTNRINQMIDDVLPTYLSPSEMRKYTEEKSNH